VIHRRRTSTLTERPSAAPGHRPRRVARPLAFALAAGSIAASTIVGSACGGSDENSDTPSIPSVELTDLRTGAPVDASTIVGPAVVNLWATWCGPCRKEMPAFQQVSTELTDVQFVGVNQGDAGDAASAFLDEVGVTFDQYLDPNGELTNSLEVAGLPATFLVDADGTVIEVHNGALDADGIRALVAELDAAPGA
jgi:thiol-disulfide isomerase/thioredoxin